jgi:Transcriptional regulators
MNSTDYKEMENYKRPDGIRLLMECYGIRRSAEHMTPELSANLRQCHDDLIRLHAADDMVHYMEADGRLHHMLMQVSGNNLALSVYDKISSLVLKFRVISLLGKERFDESVEEHCGIINNVLHGDPDAAIAMNERHLRRAKQKIMEHLVARNNA